MTEGASPPVAPEPPVLATPTLSPITAAAGEGGGGFGDVHAPGAVVTDGPGATQSGPPGAGSPVVKDLASYSAADNFEMAMKSWLDDQVDAPQWNFWQSKSYKIAAYYDDEIDEIKKMPEFSGNIGK